MFRNVLEQLSAENDKMRLDVLEANTRAALLAEEVDDTQALLEQTNQKKLAYVFPQEMLLSWVRCISYSVFRSWDIFVKCNVSNYKK